ncbi:MAG: RtcB family protein [Desulfurivibrionaceae bacterium]
MALPEQLKKIADTVWELPVSYKSGMLVPARLYVTRQLLEEMDEGVIDQISNVAMLPGIVGRACCMPDGHWGYGFPIGGVAAMDADTGVISPGGIGFDINCGMRLVRTDLTEEEVLPRLHELVDQLYRRVPSGVGGSGFVQISRSEFRTLVEKGSRWCVDQGYGWEEDLTRTEEKGCMTGADAKSISDKAVERGYKQVGTLGSGNHYLEIQVARPDNIFDQAAAQTLGIDRPNQVVIMFHCGSRGFGHQVATDYLQSFLKVMEKKYNIKVPDRQLACAPFSSPEGRDYFAAMQCAVNMAFANRQVILHRIREVFSDVFRRDAADLGMHQVYDISHNTAKLEKHIVGDREMKLLVHRKGATRAFGPGMRDIPAEYMHLGQPVIIGGSMETGSYLLTGMATGDQTFYSTAHGSGRTMSRRKAKKMFRGRELREDMAARGIYIRSASFAGLAEEAGAAYKDVDDVIEAAEQAGISRKVARFLPIGNIKG